MRFQLTILTAVRSNETGFAVWDEFDLNKDIWTIPGARMKMKEPHVGPLSAPALRLLSRLKRKHDGADTFIFSANEGQPISDMPMTKARRDMKIEGYTVHGFRSSFTDWAAEKTDVAKEIVDKALAHKLPNRVEAAYRRTDFFEKQRDAGRMIYEG